MPVKYMQWTMPGGEVVRLTISDRSAVGEDYTVVDTAKDQNRVRHMLSVLYRTRFCDHPALPDLWELKITFYENQYRLWSYSRNWKSRSSFLAGILVGKARKWKKRRRRVRVA